MRTALAYAAMCLIWGTKRHAQYDPLVTLPPSMLLGGAAVTVLGLIFEPLWHDVLSPASLGALLYLAIFGSCIAFFLMNRHRSRDRRADVHVASAGRRTIG